MENTRWSTSRIIFWHSQLIVGYGSSDGLDMGTMGQTREEVDDSLTKLLRGFSDSRLERVKEYIYNDKVRKQLAYLRTYIHANIPTQWSNMSNLLDGPLEIPPYDLRYPEAGVVGYNMTIEIFMGCDAWALGEALPNSTYVFDSGHMRKFRDGGSLPRWRRQWLGD
jgi:hypothetical protein